MQTVTINKAIKDFNVIFNNVINNSDEAVIISDVGSVVMIEKKEWESIQETMKLFKDKISLKSLLEGHKARDNNEKIDSKSFGKIFNDL